MQILFIYSLDNGLKPNGLLDSQVHIQFGISYISSFLRKHGHRTDLVVLSRLFGRKNKVIIDKYIRSFHPRLICITAVATQYDFIASIANYVKRSYPKIYLLAGGVHVTLNPEEALRGDFDALCIGEGEYPVLELVSQLENSGFASNIPNLWLKQGSEVQRNSPRQFLEHLDELPFADRDMWQKWMDDREHGSCPILISRGCPFMCSYCSNHALRKAAPGDYVRYRSSQNIVAEIKSLLNRFPEMEGVYLETETMITNKSWCLDVCAALEKLNASLKQPLCFAANIRIVPGFDFRDIFAAFRKSNLKRVKIGIESGSERIRRNVLRREYSNQDILNTAKLAREYGLQIVFYNLIGLPSETVCDFRETININRICRPDKYSADIFYPYPGTDLHRFSKEQGLLKKPPNPCDERKRPVLDLPDFSKYQIKKGAALFRYYVYNNLDPKSKVSDLLFILKIFDGYLKRIGYFVKLWLLCPR